jgi:hypothetical protein
MTMPADGVGRTYAIVLTDRRDRMKQLVEGSFLGSIFLASMIIGRGG